MHCSYWVGLGLCVVTIGCAGVSGEDVDYVAAKVDGASGNGGSDNGAAGGPSICARAPHSITFSEGTVINGAPYAGTSDTFLSSATPDTGYGDDTWCSAKGGSAPRHCLLRWDLTSLPTSTSVQRACVRFVVADGSASQYYAYELLRKWSEVNATWNLARITAGANGAKVNVPWEVPGAWGASDSGDRIAVIPATVTGFEYDIELPIAVVQKWVSSPTSNYGFMIANNSSYDGLSLMSAETAHAPILTVQLP